MRRWATTCMVLVGCANAAARKPGSEVPFPGEFEVGRRTFFDFGPPFDYYEVFIVRPNEHGASVERITFTPPSNACTAPKLETASATLNESVTTLLAKNPCAIPEKDLHRELKRCKKCLVFSGAVVSMQFQCGNERRVIRANILDRDMFDPNTKTPEHTSWTMRLLQRLDNAAGPGVMDKPIFALSPDPTTKVDSTSQTMRNIASGEYDLLFQGASDKPSELYKAAQNSFPKPTVRLVSSIPFEPIEFVSPIYPPLARLAGVEGQVVFNINVDKLGHAGEITFETGNPLLRGAVEEAVRRWKFPIEAEDHQLKAIIVFNTNCSRK